jgi:3-hydroxybutyryl-CoA dehydrogenase
MGRIKMTQSLEEGASDADIAFETVVENKDTKIDIFNKLDKLCPERTLLARGNKKSRVQGQSV